MAMVNYVLEVSPSAEVSLFPLAGETDRTRPCQGPTRWRRITCSKRYVIELSTCQSLLNSLMRARNFAPAGLDPYWPKRSRQRSRSASSSFNITLSTLLVGPS